MNSIQNYFAYSTLLAEDAFQKYCPTATLKGSFMLNNFKLGFRRYGDGPRDGGATIWREPGAMTLGRVYEVAPSEMAHLDDVSGVGRGWYARIPVEVLSFETAGRKVSAETYAIPIDRGDFEPDLSYVEKTLRGCREAGFPTEYMHGLEKLAASLSASGSRR